MLKIPEKRKRKKKKKGRQRRKKDWNWHHYLTKCRVSEYINKEKRRLQRELTREEDRLIRHKEKKLVIIHQAWNTLFPFKFPWEAVERVLEWSDNDLEIQKILLKDTQIRAWEILFGKSANALEAIRVIKRYWTPPYPPIQKIMEKYPD